MKLKDLCQGTSLCYWDPPVSRPASQRNLFMFPYFVYFVLATQSGLIATFLCNPRDSRQTQKTEQNKTKTPFMYEIG